MEPRIFTPTPMDVNDRGHRLRSGSPVTKLPGTPSAWQVFIDFLNLNIVYAHTSHRFSRQNSRVQAVTASYICLNDLLYRELIIDSLTVPVSHRFSLLVSPASQCGNVTMSHTDFSLFPLSSVSVTVSPGIFFLFFSLYIILFGFDGICF